MFATRYWIPAVALVAGLVGSTTVSAQPSGNAWGQRRGGDRALEAAYDNGYRAGLDQGRRDLHNNDRYDYGRHRLYRNGDRGYDRRYGNRNDYRRSFQQGFAAGYDAGYGRSRGGRAVPREPYGRPGPVYRHPDSRTYPRYPTHPRGGYGYPRGNYGYSEAFDRGYREGYDKGRDDGKDRDRYDPRRHKWYREGDRGYKDRYGFRDQYKAAYRDGFLRGYDEGYREGQYSRSGGWWPF